MNKIFIFIYFLLCFLTYNSISSCMEEISPKNYSPRNHRIRHLGSIAPRSLAVQFAQEDLDILDRELRSMESSLSKTSSYDSLDSLCLGSPPQYTLSPIVSRSSRKSCALERSMMSAHFHQDAPSEDHQMEEAPALGERVYVKRAGPPLESSKTKIFAEGDEEDFFPTAPHRLKEQRPLFLFDSKLRPKSTSPRNRRTTQFRLTQQIYTP